MKLTFKFNLIGIIAFLILNAILYSFLPMPQAIIWKAILWAACEAALVGICFVVVKENLTK